MVWFVGLGAGIYLYFFKEKQMSEICDRRSLASRKRKRIQTVVLLLIVLIIVVATVAVVIYNYNYNTGVSTKDVDVQDLTESILHEAYAGIKDMDPMDVNNPPTIQ